MSPNGAVLSDRTPTYALVEGVDLVVIRYDGQVSVLYGRLSSSGSFYWPMVILMAPNLICGFA